ATGGTTGRIVAIAVAYGVGSGVVLFALAVGGRKLFERVRGVGRGPALQRALGIVLVLTAVAMGTQLDVRFQTTLADHLPQFVVNPTGGIERSAAARERLADVRGEAKFDRATADAKPVSAAGGGRSKYLDLGPAPGFEGGGTWLNTRTPVSLRELRGRVVLIDFWTYTCINCIRTLPQLRTLDARYRRDGLSVVGVHTPEFPFERKTSNVRAAIARNKLRYPVVQDNAYGIWNAYGNQYWPAKYLIDARGRVRYTHFGEGGEKATESAIRALLAESGDRRLGARAKEARAIKPGAGMQTPETYFGAKRAQGWLVPPVAGTRTYRVPGRLPLNGFALGGRWKVTGESATAVRNATVTARFRARRVYLVLRSTGKRRRDVRVRVDGRTVRTVAVRGDDIYTAVDLPRAGDHDLRLDFAPGVSGYAFTFG
ncbi:MAG TPA: thioredoxin family protein, partial [Thermoleophilaceae bacterium]|nr:thioredoxin family protein [Thermoleophilaceae bacterium]